MAKPNDPPVKLTKTQERIWEKQVNEFVKCSTNVSENLKTLSSLAGVGTEQLHYVSDDRKIGNF